MEVSVDITHWPIYSRERNPVPTEHEAEYGPWAYLDVLEQLPLLVHAGIQTQDRAIRTVFAIPTELFQIPWAVTKLN
jgi:hypothetical protein